MRITTHKATYRSQSGSQTIVEIQENDDPDKPKRSYLIERKKKIGSGQTSDVYQAYLLLQGKKPDIKNPLAAKIFKKAEFFKEQEWTIQAKYYQHIDTCVDDRDVYYGFSKLLPKETLSEYLKRRAKTRQTDHKKFDILESLKIARAITARVKLMHHGSAENSEATLHLDLKPGNIMIDFDHKKEPRIHIIDFGNAQTLASDDPANKIQVIPSGSPGYVAPEVAKGEPVGLKSDIYSLTPILMMVLGATNPIYDKQKTRKQLIATGAVPADDHLAQEREISSIPFNATHLMLSHKCIKEPCDTEQLTLTFFNRMQHINYDLRPDSDELFAFIDTLTELYRAYEHHTELNTYKLALFAKLILMAQGLWDGVSANYDYIGETASIAQHRKLFCKVIFDLESKKLLNRELVQRFSEINRDNLLMMSSIVLLNESNLLDKIGLDLVCENITWSYLFNQLKQNHWKISAPLITMLFDLTPYVSVLLPISKFTTQSFFKEASAHPIFLQQLQELEKQNVKINKIHIYSTWLMNLKEEKEQLLFMKDMQRLDVQAICGYIKVKYSQRPSLENLLKKINQNQFVSDFITEYERTYQNTFFKNPNSQMWKKIKNKEVHTVQDILTHQKNDLNSRTNKIIQKCFSEQLAKNPYLTQ
ncbi:MAG: hypothetical protein A3F10_00785 [Coxiella sp. RIFCSPHIGHO2_12_FULL_42_15]|nr:MAG: hypothetical protein A3F10_00785 [Coxiella sp. RIFCSPHIGHO2_12_FULL_42_15]